MSEQVYKLTKEEIITGLNTDSSKKVWDFTTDDTTMIKKMSKLGWEPVKIIENKGFEVDLYVYEIPFKAISFRSKDSVVNPKRGKHWKK